MKWTTIIVLLIAMVTLNGVRPSAAFSLLPHRDPPTRRGASAAARANMYLGGRASRGDNVSRANRAAAMVEVTKRRTGKNRISGSDGVDSRAVKRGIKEQQSAPVVRRERGSMMTRIKRNLRRMSSS